MGEKFLREYDYEENVVPQEEPGIFLNIQEDKVRKFEEILAKRLVNTADEQTIVQAVVLAALEAEGLAIKDPQVIIDAAMHNPLVKKDALAFAENILRRNLQ